MGEFDTKDIVAEGSEGSRNGRVNGNLCRKVGEKPLLSLPLEFAGPEALRP